MLQSLSLEINITDDDKIALKLANKLNVPNNYEFVCILPGEYAKEPTVKVIKNHFKIELSLMDLIREKEKEKYD